MLLSYFHSYIFAQVIGLYLIIVAIIMVSRVSFYRRFLLNLTADYGTIVIASSLGLVVGLLIICSHNFWVLIPHILIVTLIGWAILILSILWLSIPDTMAVVSRKIYSGSGYYIVAIILAIIGILLLSKGFYLFNPHFYILR